MEKRYKKIVLRDYRQSDIEDDVRWNTTETQWALWDAPWEMEEYLKNFDEAAFREKSLKKKEWKIRDDEFRWGFEIDTADGVHIGSVNAYRIDDEYNWKAIKDEEVTKDINVTLGIDINEPDYWSGGWGTQTLTAFIQHWLDAGFENIFTQTWSGNYRMIGLAKKLGFEEVKRNVGIRQVRGEVYDGLTFRLDVARFREIMAG